MVIQELEEYRNARMKFHPTMELFYQSSTTLIPMRAFDMEMYIKHHYQIYYVDHDSNTITEKRVNLLKSIENIHKISVFGYIRNYAYIRHQIYIPSSIIGFVILYLFQKKPILGRVEERP